MAGERNKLFLLVLFAGILFNYSISTVSATPQGTDCLRNPFATGCRGISAKRSISSWPGSMDDHVYRFLPTTMPSSSFGDGARKDQTSLIKSQQLLINSAVELLIEAASRLASLGQSGDLLLMGSRSKLCGSQSIETLNGQVDLSQERNLASLKGQLNG